MATTLYLRNSTSAGTISGFSGTIKDLLLVRGAAATSQPDSTLAGLAGDGTASQVIGTSSIVDLSINLPSTGTIWMTKPLNAITLAASMTCNIRSLETNAMANYGIGAVLFKVVGTTGSRAASGTFATEFGTAEAASSFTVSASGIVLAAGNRLGVVVFYISAGGSSASGFQAQTFWDGPTSGASGDSFLSTTDTLSEQTGPAASLVVNPRRDARKGAAPARIRR